MPFVQPNAVGRYCCRPCSAPRSWRSPPPSRIIFIHAGAVLDRPGETPRGPSTIIVRGGRVEAIRDGYVAPTDGARLIDLKSQFVLPGLIDAHVHIFSDDDKMRARARGPEPRRRGRSADWRRQRAADAGGRVHDGAGPRLRRPQRDRAARRHRVGPGGRADDRGGRLAASRGRAATPTAPTTSTATSRSCGASHGHQHLQRRRRLPPRRAPRRSRRAPT